MTVLTVLDRGHARVVNVSAVEVGDEVRAAAAIGALELPVGDTGGFDEDGGWVAVIGDEEDATQFVEYVGIGGTDDAPVLTLATGGLPAAVVEFERVVLYTGDPASGGKPVTVYEADLVFDDQPGGDAINASISQSLADALPQGARTLVGESVIWERSEEGGEVTVIQIAGDPLERDPDFTYSLGPELVVNGGFEKLGGDGLPVGWFQVGVKQEFTGEPGGGSGFGTATMNTTTPITGSKSLRLDITDATANGNEGRYREARTSPRIPVEPGETYLATCLVRSSDPATRAADRVAVDLTVMCNETATSSGSFFVLEAASLSPGGATQRLMGAFTVPDNCYFARPSVRVYAEFLSGSDTIFADFDSVSVRKMPRIDADLRIPGRVFAGDQFPIIIGRTAYSAPAFQNSWAHVDGRLVAFWRDNRQVHIVGHARLGASGTTVFTLPQEYRPAMPPGDRLTPTDGAALARVSIGTDGAVRVTTTGAFSWVSLGCSFPLF